VADRIAASAGFRAEVELLAEALERPFGDVLAEARTCLNELATVQSPLGVDVFRLVMSPLHARAWTVEADTEQLARLRELGREHALVFLPSHRTYVDAMVMGEVLRAHGFPQNHILGGANMAFFPLGPAGRRAGVVWIRRDFGDDPIYKLACREFLGHLVSERLNLEWYIEGGRTRTGKLRPPRYGLLSYLVKAIEAGRAADVQLVPVSIVYDHLHELAAIAGEHDGARKQKEGLAWLADYVRLQRTHAGAARVSFGEPFSLSEALTGAGTGPARLEKVAFAVCDGINRATPVTAASLATYALLGAHGRALTLREVRRVVTPLLDYAQARGIPGPVAELRDAAALEAALDQVVSTKAATRFNGGDEPVWSIATGGEHVAAFHRNGSIHWFVNRAIVELVLVRLAEQPPPGDPLPAMWEDALALRDLLKFEFFFSDKREFREQTLAEVKLLEPDGLDAAVQASRTGEPLARATTLLADRVLRPFVDAQYVVARVLAACDPREALDPSAFVARCAGLGRQLLLQGRLRSPDAVSHELFRAALALARNRELVGPGGDELAAARAAYLEELRVLVQRLERLAQLDEQRLTEALDDRDG
jgi:glycerol-3-phosphate O-acyltransferase